jgi:hypothetical protein
VRFSDPTGNVRPSSRQRREAIDRPNRELAAVVVFDTGSPDVTATAVNGDPVTRVWSYRDDRAGAPEYGWRQEVFPCDRLVTVLSVTSCISCGQVQ